MDCLGLDRYLETFLDIAEETFRCLAQIRKPVLVNGVKLDDLPVDWLEAGFTNEKVAT